MTNTKDVILKLKEVKKEKGLSLDKIIALIEENEEYVSKSTLSRVFSDGSEDRGFRYETTLRPIANALLDIETIEDSDDPDTQAYKSILKLKKDVIEENSKKIAELQEELQNQKTRYHKKFERETAHFQRSLDFATAQIALKDKRIDQLLDMNEKLTQQLLSCPCRQRGTIEDET